jgi:hypothetical protein
MEQILTETKRLADAGHFSQAEALLRASLVLNDENPDLLKVLAQILIQTNQYEALAEIAKKLRSLEEKNPDIESRNELLPENHEESALEEKHSSNFDYATNLESEELFDDLSNNLLSNIDSHKSTQDIYYKDESHPERAIDINSISESFEYDQLDDEASDEDLADEDEFSSNPGPDEDFAIPIDDDAPSRRELSHIPNITSRKARAHQIALKIVNEFELSLKAVELLQTIFYNHWWSKTQTVIRGLLESGATEKELSLAYEVRKLWALKSEFHEVIWRNEVIREYKSLPWVTCLDLVRAYQSYPQIEEIEGYLDEAYQEWGSRASLQREFNSFLGMVQDILENYQGEEPPSMSDFR